MTSGAVDYVYRISDGVEGVRETLAVMRTLVRDAKKDGDFVRLAREVVASVPKKDWRRQIIYLFHYVRNNIRYVLDPNGVEVLATPQELLEIGAGDCDEMATLLAALLESNGHPTRFVAVGFEAGDLSHVYVETKFNDKWVALDPTENFGPGWSPEDVKNRYIVNNS